MTMRLLEPPPATAPELREEFREALTEDPAAAAKGCACLIGFTFLFWGALAVVCWSR